MWNGFIGQRIAATNKTLRRLGTTFLLMAACLTVYELRTFINNLQGPIALDEARLADITNPSVRLRNYATVLGQKAVATGITSIQRTTRNGVVESERTTAELMALLVGNHILVVKARPGETSAKYTGELVALPEDVKREIFSQIAEPHLRSATFPLLLDAAANYGGELVLVYIAIGALLFLALYATAQSKRRTEIPERHPISKELSQYGPLYSIVPEIDADVAHGTSTLSSTTFSRNWIISCWLTQVAVMKRDEIIWAYKKQTRHSLNFIPTGSSYGLVLRDSRGKLLELTSSEKNVDFYLKSLAEQTPWVVFGHDRKLEKLYKKERQAFAQTVSERRAAMGAAKA